MPVGCIRKSPPFWGRSCSNCVIRGLLREKCFQLHPAKRSCVIPDETPNILSPSYTHSLIERRKDAYILLQSSNRAIPQFARYSLSLAIGATIAGLSPDRGTALVAEKHPSPSRSSSWPQRGTGHGSTSFLEMQLGAHFC